MAPLAFQTVHPHLPELQLGLFLEEMGCLGLVHACDVTAGDGFIYQCSDGVWAFLFISGRKKGRLSWKQLVTQIIVTSHFSLLLKSDWMSVVSECCTVQKKADEQTCCHPLPWGS